MGSFLDQRFEFFRLALALSEKTSFLSRCKKNVVTVILNRTGDFGDFHDSRFRKIILRNRIYFHQSHELQSLLTHLL